MGLMRILLCGDTVGIQQLLRYVPHECAIGIIGASIRPQYFCELKLLADANKIPLLIQPKWKSHNYKNYRDRVLSLKPDLVLVNSYSMIIREDILSACRLGGINVHAALLPLNRGCNPIQWAIIHNEHKTGVSLHEIDSGLDTGPLIDQRSVPIFVEDTWLAVRDRLSQATEALLSDNLPVILSEDWSAKSQLHSHATLNPRRYPEDGAFTWSESVLDIHNKIRALLPPLPAAHYYTLDNKRIEIREYRTPWQVTIDKYSSDLGGCVMQSEYIRLRPLQESDALSLYELYSNKKRIDCNSSNGPMSVSDCVAWIERMVTTKSDLIFFVIEDIETNKDVGICQLVNINWLNQSAELQIHTVNTANQAKDLSSEAIKLLRKFSFHDLNLHRVNVHRFVEN